MLLTSTGSRHPHTRRHLRLVHVKPRNTLKDRLHRTSHASDLHHHRPWEPPKQTNLMNVLMATIPNPGGGSRARLKTGTQAPWNDGVAGRPLNHPPISSITNARSR